MGSILPETEKASHAAVDPSQIVLEDPNGRLVGLYADPACPNLLGACTRDDLTPGLGTELRDIQLKDVTDVQAEELAKFVAQRGCVVFRNQTWTSEEQVALGYKLGTPNVSDRRRDGEPDEMLYNHTDKNSIDAPGEAFHSDGTAKKFPPSYTIIHITKCPPNGGGDTAFCNMYAAYDKLSEAYKEFITGKWGINKRPQFQYDSVESPDGFDGAHPLVRTHPLTGWNSLFMSELNLKYIKGLTIREAVGTIQTLTKHVDKSPDIYTRVRWEPNTTVILDNRSLIHSASWDYWPQERETRNVTVFGAEKPFLDPNAGSQARARNEAGRLPPSFMRADGLKKSTIAPTISARDKERAQVAAQ